jgi:hypothetical protein
MLKESKDLSERLVQAVLGIDSANNRIRADIRGALYKFAVKNGDDQVYDKILELFRNSDISEEKNRCMVALASTKSQALLEKTLNWATFSGEVRSQDMYYVFAAVSSSGLGRNMAWGFVKKNWETIKTLCNRNLCSALVSSVLSGYTDVKFTLIFLFPLKLFSFRLQFVLKSMHFSHQLNIPLHLLRFPK